MIIAANWSLVVLTLALVGVTWWYANHTRDMVDEMKAAREADVKARKREKSERAAYACLDAVRTVLRLTQRRGPARVDRKRFADLRDALRAEGSLIMDETVRDRTQASAEVAHVASSNDEQMDLQGLNPAAAAAILQGILSATERVLVKYLTEQEPGEWDWDTPGDDGRRATLPSAAEAGAWIREKARSGE